MVSALAVMWSSSPAMNSACVPPPREKQNFPQFPCSAVIAVDRLIHGVGVDLAGSVAVDRRSDMAEQLGQLRLVVGAHAFARGAALGFGAHDQDATVFRSGRVLALGLIGRHGPPGRSSGRCPVPRTSESLTD